jgi:hypothetical protein
MDKLKGLTGRNLDRVFKFRRGCLHALQLYYFETKLPNLKLKTQPKQLLGSPHTTENIYFNICPSAFGCNAHTG